MHAAATRGCRVTTTTISREQYEHACERVRAAGLDDRVTVLARTTATSRGRYDKLVSIEMIEAVGYRDFGTFFARCSDLLTGDGRMLLQAIVIDDRAYEVEKASPSFIRTHIFPDGCLPSLEVIARCLARHTDMRTVGLEDLTPHYPETLRRWRANFEGSRAAPQASATTNALGGCGGCTSPTARPVSPSGASVSCRWAWRSLAWREPAVRRAGPRCGSPTPRRARSRSPGSALVLGGALASPRATAAPAGAAALGPRR